MKEKKEILQQNLKARLFSPQNLDIYSCGRKGAYCLSGIVDVFPHLFFTGSLREVLAPHFADEETKPREDM